MNPFTTENAKSKIDKFSKTKDWVKLKNKQNPGEVLLKIFPMNGLTLGVKGLTWNRFNFFSFSSSSSSFFFFFCFFVPNNFKTKRF